MKILKVKRQEDILREWDQLAALRLKQISSGSDVTYKHILVTEIVELAKPLAGVAVLDIGCGVGVLSEKLAQEARTVVAIDPSRVSISTASGASISSNISFVVATVQGYAETAIVKYDRIVSNMSMSCALDLDGFLSAVAKLLAKDGIFIFSIPHPCFWPEYYGYARNEQFEYSNEFIIEAPFRISNDAENMMVSTHVHRPLARYMESMHAAGLVLRSIYEPLPNADVARLYARAWKVPRYLFGVCKKAR